MLTDKEKNHLTENWARIAIFFNCPPLKPSPPKIGCVYAAEMSDDTVKIGVTQDVDRRINEIQRQVYLDVKRVYHTDYAPFDFVTKVEKACHAAFADRRVRGEYFDITFEEAVAELDSHADEIADALHKADQRYLDEIDYFFNEFLPEYKAKFSAEITNEFEEETDATFTEEFEEEFALAYVLEMSNNTLRIGQTCNFNEELRRITEETNLDIKNFCTSPFMSFLDAWHLKNSCEYKYLKKISKGECCTFAEVKAVLQASPVDKLLAIADRMEPSPEKNILLNQAAAIILS